MAELDGRAGEELVESIDLISDRVSDAVVNQVLDDLADEISPEILRAIRGDGLESMPPAKGIERFLEKKSESVAPGTLAQHETKLGYLREYLVEELGLEDLNEFTPRDAEDYKRWRREESLDREEPLAPKTLKDDMHLYRQFLDYMARLRATSDDVPEVVEIPRLDTGEGVEKETLDPERAGDILDYLDRLEYASLEHVVFLLLAKTGRRPCDLRALDLDDFDDEGEEVTIRFVHRPDTGTELKAGVSHEAKITLSEQTGEAIRTFIDYKRPDVTDDEGREPLLATVNGRISKSTIREYAYKWSRPCAIGKECPHDRKIEDCDAAQSTKDASKCPGSRSPRTVRSGYITAKLNAGASFEAVGHRVGATRDVLEKHYDHPNEDEERERYQDEIMGSNSEGSGYSNIEGSPTRGRSAGTTTSKTK